MKKKGTHCHCIMQQVTADTPASSITAVPIQHVPLAKVIAEDLINLQLRLGSPNTLVMAASESTSSHGRGGRSGKREPQPPSESRTLADITRSTGSGSGVVARKDGEEADNLEPGMSQLTAITSKESDFAADRHQMIPANKCFGLPIVPRQSGGFKLNYSDAVEVTNFQGIYYFESGYLRPGYTNTMPYDHPLDRQGHISSALHSGVAAYSSYIRLITLGILLPQKKETCEGYNELHYFNVVVSIPQTETHSIWGSLHFLPLVSNVFLSHYDSRTFLSHLAAGEYGFYIIGSPCIDIYQMYVVVPMIQGGIPYVGVGLIYQSPSLYVGTNEDCTIFPKAFIAHCESSIDITPSQAFFLRKRRELGPLCHPMLSWRCVDTITACPGVINPEGAQAHTIHSSQTLTFHMLLATKHHFHGIQERANVIIPLEFRDLRDIRPRRRTASFQYLNRVWEWVQVMTDHVASHYTLLANANGAKQAQSQACHQVSTVTPPTECSMAIDLPSARLSHKGVATTRLKGLVQNVKVDPGSSNPPGPWNSWDEYLQDKPGELTPDQIIGVVTQNQCKINRSIARILKLFNWYSSSRMVSIIGHFNHRVGSEAKSGEGQRWRRALMDFAYRNITFNMKQLVEVLRCDLQVTIQEGLMETQT